ncbi:hypothetical protein EfmAA610_31770 (plasmid) [Enterococcus faecium]|nr:hypothetical protein EfmAA610_31770 [Enterococcus faecium]
MIVGTGSAKELSETLLADANAKINRMIDQMEPVKKESYLDPTVFEADEHIQKVIHKMFRPDNAYTKFDSVKC